jgi:DNA repair protein RecN (Recombination protein N)
MIDELHARNVALIKDAAIWPAAGLTVITGETGSGKTALLSAIKLLVGERAEASMVREGADALEVEGRVYVADEDDEEGHIVKRRVDVRGRGRVSVDGSMASVKELAAGIGATIDLCGQHEHRRLLSNAEHMHMLEAAAPDEFEGPEAVWRERFEAAEAASAELARVEALARTGSERIDQARFVAGRIDEVDPKEGELEEIEARLGVVEHADTLLRLVEAAREALVGDEGTTDSLYGAVRDVTEAARYDEKLSKHVKTLESVSIDIEDVAQALRAYRDRIEVDPEELARLQERHAKIQGLLRQFGPTMEAVFAKREEAREVIELADNTDELLGEARAARDAAEAALIEAADALEEVYRRSAPVFADAVSEQMTRLEMGGASVEFRIERLKRASWTKKGPCSVELLYRPAAGLSARPLRKIASGGEMSRVTLAIRVVLGQGDSVETLVFDEVDAGVGGAVANALAKVLKDLARTHQVICVTHLAQVAVAGEKHYVVGKTSGDVPETVLEEVSGQARVREVARMLSGDTGAAALEHAKELLADAV